MEACTIRKACQKLERRARKNASLKSVPCKYVEQPSSEELQGPRPPAATRAAECFAEYVSGRLKKVETISIPTILRPWRGPKITENAPVVSAHKQTV